MGFVLLRESWSGPQQVTMLMKYLVIATIGLWAIGYFAGVPDCRVQNGDGPGIANSFLIPGCPAQWPWRDRWGVLSGVAQDDPVPAKPPVRLVTGRGMEGHHRAGTVVVEAAASAIQ